MPSRLLIIAAVLLSLFITVLFFWYSQSILIPFIFAVLIWNLLRTMAFYIQKIPKIGAYIPRGIAVLLAVFLSCFVFALLGKILTDNAQDMITSSGTLQKKFAQLIDKIPPIGLDKANILEFGQSVLKQINFQELFIGFYSSISNIMSSLFMIIIFVIFFFMEEVHFDDKIRALFSHKKQNRDTVEHLLQAISQAIQHYLTLKSLFNALTGFSVYLVMKVMHLEYAEFWGVAVFIFNFIPNLGALVMTVVMTLFAYFQWMEPSKTFIFLGLQLVVHGIVGNYLEPRYLGQSMHLSPLFILLSLSFWGILWGGTGLFLAVPMTVMMMIILSYFKVTRPWAILMSERGELPGG
ncbi:MAG: AI-2E family transporter [Gammaproteobacteria bacterium]|nr:AI-2E family transporter [Gammaproteobacteria bacterium]